MSSPFDLAPDEWVTLRRLLDDVLARPEVERATWVDQLDVLYEPLKPRLRALIAHAAAGSGALPLDALPRVETAEFAGAPPDGRLREGARIGPYRLLRPLGEGGMGEVWLAERTDMLQRRQVALKLPRLLAGRSALAERLAREREILATLAHPNIARLYDAGIAGDGQPYLALEYVEGERIDAHCARKALDVPARLRLFLQVARAVAHAHANLVVHRDLKPANILVTAAGEVKLLDFGIAKLLEEGRAQETELTQLGGRALTPDYAAPEQILGRPIGTGADVYALGVVLFELLAGQRPYKLKRDSRAALEEAIVQAEAPRPSSVVADARLRKPLRGDLDTIVLKALKKVPAERYGTADAFADDVERHLQDRPVLAQPDRHAYRLRKFIARNKLTVGASAAILVALLTGAGVATWQAGVAQREQRRAEEVKRFVTRLFTDADPFSTSTGELTVEALLQTAQARVQQSAGQTDALRVELLEMIGRSLIGLSKFDRAEEVLNQAVDEGRRALGDHHRLTIRARLAMTSLHRFRGRQAQMRSELAALMPHLRANSADHDEELFGALMNSAHLAIDEGRPADAQAESREALSIARRIYGESHAETATAALLVAGADNFGTDAGKALASSALARELLIAVYGTHRPHARVLDGRFVFARALANAGRYAEAVQELKEVKRDTQALLGPTAPMAGFVAADIARFQLEMGDAREALPNSEEALDIVTRIAQEESFTVAAARLYVGRAQLATLRLDDAIRTFDRARESMRKVRGADSAEAADLTALQALALAYAGRIDEARRAIEPEVTRFRKASPFFRHRGLHIAGVIHRLAGDLDAADGFLHEAASTLPELPVHFHRRAATRAELARVALERGRHQAALDLLDRMPALPSADEPVGPELAESLLTRGRALLELGRADRALTTLHRVDAYWQAQAPSSRWAGEAGFWVGRCYAALGRTADARTALARAAGLLARSPFASDARLLKQARAG